MINKIKTENSITRRFNEVFLVDPTNFTQEDFEYFIKRTADFYQYIAENHPSFISDLDKKASLIDAQLLSENTAIDKFIEMFVPIVEQLNENLEFKEILLEGKKEHESYIGQGVHSVSPREGIYLSWDFNLKILSSNKLSEKVSFDQARKILLDLNRLLYELKTIEKTALVPDIDNVLQYSQESLNLLSRAEKKTNRIFDYSRITSSKEIEDIWKYYYDDDQTYSSTSLRIHLAKESIKSSTRGEMFSARRVSKEIKIDLQRFYNSILDWLDSQNFLEEALINFKTWAEIVNNDYFRNEIKSPNEDRLKQEFSKYLFATYNILAIREPDFITKRPD